MVQKANSQKGSWKTNSVPTGNLGGELTNGAEFECIDIKVPITTIKPLHTT